MTVGIIRFPGASGADDVAHAFAAVLGVETRIIWHEDEAVPECDLLVLPGGYSFADYLRPGALARTSPIAPAIRRCCRERRVLGIGNGFQILCELGVLPGALLTNADAKFCPLRYHVKIEESSCKLTQQLTAGTTMALPLACYTGRYYADQRILSDLDDRRLVVLRYCDEYGDVSDEYSPTGAVASIAGLTNYDGNVLGIMVHPERCVEQLLGGTQGAALLKSALG